MEEIDRNWIGNSMVARVTLKEIACIGSYATVIKGVFIFVL
jgi:hypothetical protein